MLMLQYPVIMLLVHWKVIQCMVQEMSLIVR